MHKLIFFLLILLGFFACKQKKSESLTTSETEPIAEEVIESTESEPKEDDPFLYTTETGKKFKVKIDTGLEFSLQNIHIQTIGFEQINEKFSITEVDPIEDIFLADLNKDGFEELYVTTRSVGSGGYSTLYGFASNSDKSVSQINIPDLIGIDPDSEGLYEGFSGHNTYSIEDGKMVISFPVYMPGDSNAQPTGGERKIIYVLEKAEASWTLNPLSQDNIS